jgi:sugar lactone lactonase YvrE
MAARPSHHPRLLPIALTLAALLAALMLAAAVAAAPASAATPDTYFFVSSVGPTFGSSGQYQFGANGAGPNGVATDNNGNVYVTLPKGFAKFYSTGTLACVYTGDNGYVAGNSYGLDIDSNGNVYYADRDNHCIVKLHPDDYGLQGNVYRWVSITGKNGADWTAGGAGGGDANIGTGNGEFNFPNDVAYDNNSLYVTDLLNNRVQKFDTATYDGSLSFVAKWGKNSGAGGAGSSGSGDGEFSGPRGIATDAQHNIYVAESSNHRVQVLTAAGVFVKKFGSTSSGDPLYLSDPVGLDVDADGSVYVADLDAATSRVDKFRVSGATYTLASRTGGWGSGDGQFQYPWAPAVAPNGYLYVADTQNKKLKKFARDATAPTVTPLGFPASWVKALGHYELQATDPTVAGQYTSNGVSIYRSMTGGAPWMEYLEPLVSLDFVEGDNTVTYYASDAVGNASTPAAVHLYWDKTVPITSASGASTGWTRTAQTITLTPSSDGYSPMSSTQYRLQGAASWTTYAAPFQVSADGERTYEFRSTDTAGNVETPKTVDVKVDGTAPVTTVSGLTGGGTNDLSGVTFEGSDPTSGVASTEWSADSGAHWSTGSLAGVFPEGVNSVQYRSTDNACNVESAKTATVSYDLSKPVPAALASKSVKRLKTVKLPFRVDDLLCPSAKVTIKIYKGAKLKKTLSPGLKTVGVSLTYSYKCKLAKGKYTWKVFATDLAGNQQAVPGAKKLTVK